MERNYKNMEETKPKCGKKKIWKKTPQKVENNLKI